MTTVTLMRDGVPDTTRCETTAEALAAIKGALDSIGRGGACFKLIAEGPQIRLNATADVQRAPRAPEADRCRSRWSAGSPGWGGRG